MRKTKLKILNAILAIVIILSTLMPVVNAADANLNLERTTGSLKITKMEVENNEQRPLAGVTFDIYKIGDTTDSVTSTEIPTDETILATKQSKTTGEDGIVQFTDLELGRYLVVESNAPTNVVSKIANFIVDVPMTEENGTKLNYDVEVTPKNNTAYGEFTIKTEDTKGNRVGGVKYWMGSSDDGDLAAQEYESNAQGELVFTGLPVGEYAFFIGEIPVESLNTVLGNAPTGFIEEVNKVYNFTVSLDQESGLTKVEPESITVILEKPEAKLEIISELKDGSAKIGDKISYKLTADIPSVVEQLDTFEVGATNDRTLEFDISSFKGYATLADGNKVDFDSMADGEFPWQNFIDYGTENVLKFINGTFNTDRGVDITQIEVTYDMILTREADSTSIGNRSLGIVAYSNRTGLPTELEPEIPVLYNASKITTIYTGGFWLLKTNTSDEVLKGATFKVASSEANAKAGVYLTDETGEEITLTTGEDGKVSYKGLTYGKYYLVETAAPSYVENEETKYYNLLKKPVEIEVTKDTYAAETETAKIINKKGFDLPATGGMGTVIISIIGIALIVAGTAVYRKDNK